MWFTYVLVFILATVVCPAVVRANLSEGLVSAWLFDDSANDAVGSNDGDLQGAADFAAGKFGRGLLLNGADSYVEVPDDKSLHLPDAITISAWINVAVGGDHAGICWKGEKIGWGANFSWRMATTSNTNMTWGRCPVGTEGWFATDNVITTNEWYHVALVGDGTRMWCYVNGEEKSATSAQGGWNTPGPYQAFEGKPVEIGVGRAIGGTVGNDTYFNGVIDEVLIYDRALPEEEIVELANGASIAGELAVDPKGKLATTWGNIRQ